MLFVAGIKITASLNVQIKRTCSISFTLAIAYVKKLKIVPYMLTKNVDTEANHTLYLYYYYLWTGLHNSPQSKVLFFKNTL